MESGWRLQKSARLRIDLNEISSIINLAHRRKWKPRNNKGNQRIQFTRDQGRIKSRTNKQNLFLFHFKAAPALIYLFDCARSSDDPTGTLNHPESISSGAQKADSVSYIYDSIKLMQISGYTLFVHQGISYKIAERLPIAESWKQPPETKITLYNMSGRSDV